MHCFDDLQFKFELCREIQKKRRKYMKYSKNLSKNTKIGNQSLANVPLAKKKTQPKNLKKNTSLPRAWWGPRQRCLCRGWAVGTEVCSADGQRQLSANDSQPG
jgi:hypothetical protein